MLKRWYLDVASNLIIDAQLLSSPEIKGDFSYLGQYTSSQIRRLYPKAKVKEEETFELS